jgi:putative toxin-antitoxin system antitoxin component (TIGR02293 family)
MSFNSVCFDSSWQDAIKLWAMMPKAETLALDYPSVLKRVQEMLGVGSLRTDQDLMKLVEEHLPTRAVEALRQSGLTDEEVYSLVVPRRTLSHRRARREALSRDESDRVVRVARVVALCEAVFGERVRSWKWLRDAKRQFQGRAPLDLLATEAGARLVEELLYRIDEGMAA